MSSPGFVAEGLHGPMTQAECDRLHFLKNRPEPPTINGLELSFPPYAFRPYPQAMYGPWSDEAKLKALRTVARQRELDLNDEYDYREAESHIAAFDTRLVQTDRECADWLAKGWADEPGGVKSATERLEQDIATAAAHRNWDDRQMSPAAKAEADAVEAAREDFVPEVPETPIKRGPGRPPKLITPPDAA